MYKFGSVLLNKKGIIENKLLRIPLFWLIELSLDYTVYLFCGNKFEFNYTT